MSITAKALREKRHKLIQDSRAVIDKAEAEKRELDGAERCGIDKVLGGFDADGKRIVGEEEKLKGEIDRLERQERLEQEMNGRRDDRRPGSDGQPNPDGDTRDSATSEAKRALAFQAWILHQTGRDLRADHEEAARAVGLNVRAKELEVALQRGRYREVKRALRGWRDGESRAGASNPQSVLLQGGGAALVPEGFVMNLEEALLQYGGMRDAADVMRTDSGNPLPWPTVNDTTVKGAILAENQTVTTGDMTFSLTTFNAYKYTSKLILVPAELIEDAAFQLADFIGEACGIRIGRIQADHFTTGTGASQPNGAITAATLGTTALSSTGIAGDDIYTLKHSIDPAYRKAGVAWSMHDQILLAIKKLKDGFGRYLWQNSLAGGRPDTLDGDPIFINQSMASTIGSGNKTLLYGQHQKYKIRDVAAVRLRRLVERYADQDQEGFVMFMRSDGNLLDAGTHPLKYLQH